jgi:hypothetical protein
MTNLSGTNFDRKAGRATVDCTDRLHNLTRIETGEPQVIPARDDRLRISVPIQIKRRSGRKLVIHPTAGHGGSALGRRANAPAAGTGPRSPLARQAQSRVVKLLRELASGEGVDSSYVSWMVNLTTLAPDTVAAVLNETLPPDPRLFDLGGRPAGAVGGAARLAGQDSRKRGCAAKNVLLGNLPSDNKNLYFDRASVKPPFSRANLHCTPNAFGLRCTLVDPCREAGGPDKRAQRTNNLVRTSL